jgi:hypothetical protein
MAAWQSQYDRLLRSLRKVERADEDPTVQLDDLFSFFQNCWHLKDWIKNDDARNDAGHPTGRDVEREEAFALLQLFPSYCKVSYDVIDCLKTQKL